MALNVEIALSARVQVAVSTKKGAVTTPFLAYDNPTVKPIEQPGRRSSVYRTVP